MIKKRAPGAALLLTAGLLLGSSLATAPAATAAPSVAQAVNADPAVAPTLIKTGERSVMVMWGESADGSAVKYLVVLRGESTGGSKSVTDTRATFTNLDEGDYTATVIAVDAAGTQAEGVSSNTVRLGTGGAATPTSTPSSSATPSTSPSTASPTPNTSPSTTPSATPSTSPSAVSPTPSQTPSAAPSATAAPSTPAVVPNADLSATVAAVQPWQWGLGALIALATFGALSAGFLRLRRR